ncbi:hypothetical protein ACLOJK_002441 [Asimina triloba]
MHQASISAAAIDKKNQSSLSPAKKAHHSGGVKVREIRPDSSVIFYTTGEYRSPIYSAIRKPPPLLSPFMKKNHSSHRPPSAMHPNRRHGRQQQKIPTAIVVNSKKQNHESAIVVADSQRILAAGFPPRVQGDRGPQRKARHTAHGALLLLNRPWLQNRILQHRMNAGEEDDQRMLRLLFDSILEVTAGALEEQIGRINESATDEGYGNITCIIADGSMASAISVARKMGTPNAAFWPASVGSLAATQTNFLGSASTIQKARTIAEENATAVPAGYIIDEIELLFFVLVKTE